MEINISEDEPDTNLSEAEEDYFPSHQLMVCMKKNINILIVSDNIPEKNQFLLHKNEIYVVNEKKNI
ncbi:MAG: hypothetical protein CMB64_04710 [Euryarchaeota archaeon]|nr:hypothetical protein [Euryarchaeota archaeon]|tara:strand:+ start:542 stop:742 length:201 start_codon:yes stop_codon:yes gene_type:complete